MTNHVNKFNSILSRIMSVEIKFEDDVMTLLPLSSLPDSWSGTVTLVINSDRGAKLTFEGILDLIRGEHVCTPSTR